MTAAPKRAHYDPTITLGNLMTFFGMLAAGIAMLVVWLIWGVQQSGRIDQNEYRINEVDERVEQGLDDLTRALGQVETRIGRQIDGLGASVDRIENILLRPERASP